MEEVEQNTTWYQLSGLEPGSTYLVAVAGVNSNGVGNFSEYQTVMTLSPEGMVYMLLLSHKHKLVGSTGGGYIGTYDAVCVFKAMDYKIFLVHM